MPEIYKYEFDEEVASEDIDAAIVLATFAAESLHGAQAFLDLAFVHDDEQRKLVVEAGTPSGRDFNRMLVGFLRREFDDDAFRVERIAATAN